VLDAATDHGDLYAHLLDADLRKLLLVATVTALCGTALIAIVALVAGDFGDTELRILATTGGFGLASLIATRGTALLDQGREHALAYTVIVLAALAFVTELWVIWLDTDSEVAWKSYVCVIAAAGAFGQIAGMVARRRATDPPTVGALVWAAGTCAAVLALMTWYAALAEIDEPGYYQLFGVVAVLDVLALLLQPAVRRFGEPRTASAAAPAAGTFTVVLADGRRIDHERGADLPTAVASALREHGEGAIRIELGRD
jgi:hypothetical protein